MVSRKLATALGLVAILLSSCESPTRAEQAVYHVSADGDDQASGLSWDEAWASLDRVTEQNLLPGDVVRLGGTTPLRGTLRITSDDAGTPENPVTITGEEEFPGILAEGNAGIDIVDTSGVSVTNLNIRGTEPESSAHGVLVTVSPGGGRKEGISLTNLGIRDVYQGIAVGAERPGDGFTDITIDDVNVTDAVRNGIVTYGPPAPDNAIRSLRISDSTVIGTRGIPEFDTNTGSGIVVGSAKDAVVEGNVASNNGAESNAPEGPIGIWTHDSTCVVIRDNVSHHNRTVWTDGGGFGVDVSSSDVLVEHNLSHDNHGAGYLAYTRAGAQPMNRITFRYNTSVDDGRHDQIPAAFALLGGLDDSDPTVRISDLEVYDNTIVASGNPEGTALLLSGTLEDARIHHNVFDARGGKVALRVLELSPAGEFSFNSNQVMSADALFEERGMLGYTLADLEGIFHEAADNSADWSEYPLLTEPPVADEGVVEGHTRVGADPELMDDRSTCS